MSDLDPVHIAARSVLLDALVGLAEHRDAVIVAGAQAVYLHTGEGDLAIAPFTSDGDLAIDPEQLGSDPRLEDAMRGAGFELSLRDGHVEPGVWLASTTVGNEMFAVPVDLIVPETLAGGGRRGARLGGHGNRAAHRALGLEATLVDHAPMTIAALAPDDSRSLTANLAGPAALLVAKAHKLNDRIARGRQARIKDKDAADVVRLMQTTDPKTVGAILAMLSSHPIAGAATTSAVDYLQQMFGRRGGQGIALATTALRLAIPQARIEAISIAYTAALLDAAQSEG